MLKSLSVISSVFLLLCCTSTSAQELALAHKFKDPQLAWGLCPPFLPAGCEIAVLHGDPSLPNVDIFFKVPAGSIIPSHTHTSAERMVLVSGQMEVTYEGQPPVTLNVGSYAYGPASKPHAAACAEGAPCVLFIAFEAPLDAIPTDAAAE